MAESHLITVLKAEMARRKIGARKLALDAGLNPEAVRNIIHRRSRTPRAATLEALAAYLDVTVDYLLGRQSGEDDPGLAGPEAGVPRIPGRKPGLREWLEVQQTWNAASPDGRRAIAYMARMVAAAEGLAE